MPKEEWGTKRLCPTTGKRFYDLNRDPVVSPYTGEIVDTETGRSKMLSPEPEPAKGKSTKETSEEGEVIEGDSVDVDLGDEVLEDEDDGNVSLDDIADVSSDEDEG
ncbi:TIGR02300 family protein [Rhodosalinus sediminis]|uniref:TIGR02300 family protein n=1 Tax=Rhodosalinus sediminis TaxID=1940533 RepID=A0A3D9C0E6_9RHOB|nr:TIGR02300 family protein [Rhodosalinus sediminis]REC58991.1 TIGR02300 family protein [Rhodosalinus sediminis]